MAWLVADVEDANVPPGIVHVAAHTRRRALAGTGLALPSRQAVAVQCTPATAVGGPPSSGAADPRDDGLLGKRMPRTPLQMHAYVVVGTGHMHPT